LKASCKILHLQSPLLVLPIIRGSLNLSVLDVSGEYAREADIAFVSLSQNSLGSAQYREKIEKMLERNFSEYHFDLEYEEI